MKNKTLTNKNGVTFNIGDRISVNGPKATVVGFHNDMLQVEMDNFPGSPITVDAAWHIEKISDRTD